MRRVACILFSVATVIATSSPASAASITDTFDPADQYFFSGGGTCNGVSGSPDTISGLNAPSPPKNLVGCKSLTFDLVLDGYLPPDELTSAELLLFVYDNVDPGSGNPENVQIKLDLDANFLANGGSDEFSVTGYNWLNAFNVFGYVEQDGILTVKLVLGPTGIGQADFFFNKATLTGVWTDREDPGPDSVPEPATLLMMGGGLAAAAAGLRRRFKTSKA